jgi:hypothetical protein
MSEPIPETMLRPLWITVGATVKAQPCATIAQPLKNKGATMRNRLTSPKRNHRNRPPIRGRGMVAGRLLVAGVLSSDQGA